MLHLSLWDPNIDYGIPLTGTYNPFLAALSILIAALAAYSAFGLAERIRASETSLGKRSWLAAGAIAMGLGVWAMHFVGMLAFRLPVPVAYDVLTTLLSIVPATLASCVVLLITSQLKVGRLRLVLGGILMGLGIGAMHYTGMAAMHMAGKMVYDPLLLVASVIVAMILATAALHTNSLISHRPKEGQIYWRKLGAAMVMGLAIAGMHYTGMAAVYFFPVDPSSPVIVGLDPMPLAVLVALATALILATVIFVTVVDSRLKTATDLLKHELKVTGALLNEAKEKAKGPVLGESVAVKALRENIATYAATDDTLLLTGPTGAGQETVACAIHHQSRRASRPFIHVNCTMLQTSPQSVLFGTVAPESNSPTEGGKFGLAHGGTLYLEGVNELPLRTQKHLVGALEELQNQREQGRPRPDVRIIAFLSNNLAEATHGSRIAPALYQALCKCQLSVPALAERREDIPVLARYFIEQHARRLGKLIETVSEGSLARLQDYRWTGNIRELENLIERAIITAKGPILDIDETLLEEGIPLDRYRLVEKLDDGGMGEVWRAKHQLLARPAAVKLIRFDMLGDSDRRQEVINRFEREAQITANLSSPNTVSLYDFGVSETGSFYFVMELLNGMDLESMVNRFGPFSSSRVILLLQQACRSLGEAHEIGLVHRDIKPANLFICKMGREYDFLKVLDFGVVKDTDSRNQALTTANGNFVGTPAYMAPELITGAPVDQRTDLYGLGCVAYWMLTGRRVFEFENWKQMVLQHNHTKPSPPSEISEIDIPDSLDQVILSCLEKTPSNRPSSVDEFSQALNEISIDVPWTPTQAEAWWQLHLPEIATDLARVAEDRWENIQTEAMDTLDFGSGATC